MSTKKEHTLSPPRRRRLNDDDSDDFVAIDFETATGLLTSACAIGMVKVIDGEIVQQFYSIINPVRDEYTDKQPNLRIHGISLATMEKSLTFDQLYYSISCFIGNLPIVCHNKGTDIKIIEALEKYYGLSGIDTSNCVCTYQLTGMSLKKCCESFHISLGNHHNALDDAEACAKIYLEIIGKPFIDRVPAPARTYKPKPKAFSPQTNYSSKSTYFISSEHRTSLDAEKLKNTGTIFMGATVVITGTFESFPIRDDLARELQQYGAKISSTISSRTSIVVCGIGAGPAKIQKIRDLISRGQNIQVIGEEKLLEILAE